MEHIKNALYIVSYVLMVAALLIVSVFFRQVLASVLLIFLIILPFISLYAGSYGARHISVSASLPAGCVCEGDDFRIRLTIRNTSPVPMLRCILDYTFCNMYKQDDRSFRMTLPGESFANETYDVSFKTALPGVFTFDSDLILVSDPLHFRTFRIKNEIHIRCYIMPRTIPIPYVPLTMYEGEAADEIVSESGELTRDIRQLREYRAGDRLKDIHWKASAQKGELIAKEYERSTDLFYLLLPEVKKGEEEKVLRRYYSLGKAMVEASMGFICSVFDPSDKSFEDLRVSDADSLNDSICRIMDHKSTSEDVYANYMYQNPECTGVIRICPEEIINT